MAWDQDRTAIKLSRVAKADLSALQFHAVKLASGGDGDQVDAITADTDMAVGILQNKPKAGMEAEIISVGVSKFAGDADLSGSFPGTPLALQVSADGEFKGAGATGYVIGQMLLAPTAAHAIGTGMFNFASPIVHA